MARKTASRLKKRREAEAASTREPKTKAKRKKKTKRAATSRRKTKAAERKRLVWGIFSGTLKEEARFPYDERDKAEEKLEQLRAKGKKSYFIQPIKEVITDPPPGEDSDEED